MITRLPRENFLNEYWQYNPGEHVFIIGPTQRAGKTTLGFQLLEHTVRPSLDTTVFCMKPRDKTVSSYTSALGFKEIPEWPPIKTFWQDKPEGYTLWPRHTYDPDKDNEHLRNEFRKAMLHGYSHGNSIL